MVVTQSTLELEAKAYRNTFAADNADRRLLFGFWDDAVLSPIRKEEGDRQPDTLRRVNSCTF